MNRQKLLGTMAEKSISQRNLAIILGMSKNTISSKINGKSYFNTEEIIKICDVLEITDPEIKTEIFLT